MTLDWLDRAFVARKPSPAPFTATAASARDSSSAIRPPPSVAALPTGPVPTSQPSEDVAPSSDSVVSRLLDAVPSEWAGLADAVESAVERGQRVVAFTGGERGEGRSTLVAGVAGVLRGRGLTVITTRQAPLLLPIEEAAIARAADVVLVDAGAWFTTGPVRRRAVEQAALGCDAAVLVRRADAPPCPPWSNALAAIGLTVLGEALTFERPVVAG